MQERVNAYLRHLSMTQEQLANLLKSKRDVAQQMASLVLTMPDRYSSEVEMASVQQYSTDVAANIASYLNSIAGLEEAMAETLRAVMREMEPKEEE